MFYTLVADNMAFSTVVSTFKSANLVKKDESKIGLNTVKTDISEDMQHANTYNSHPARGPLILAVETSGRVGSVAIATGQQLLAEKTFSAPMTHSAEIFPAIDSLLASFNREPKEIEHIYISAGPGSFTGLRIAVTMAKTMHLANAAKIVAVDTLDVIAANVITLTAQDTNLSLNGALRFSNNDKIAAILDAKRGQFFIAVYQQRRLCPDSTASQTKKKTVNQVSNKEWEKILPDSLMTVSQFLAKFADTDHPVWLLGEGLVYYKDKFEADGVRLFDESYWNPKARSVHLIGWEMAQAGQFAEPLMLQPTYLRRTEAEEKFHQEKTKS